MKWWLGTLLNICALLNTQLLQAEDISSSLRTEAQKVLPQIRAELSSKALSKDKRYSLSILLARELMAAEFYQEAQSLYEEVLELTPSNMTAEPYINLAFIKKQKGVLSQEEAEKTLAILKANSDWKVFSEEFEELYLLSKAKPKSKPYQGFYGAYKNDISLRMLINEGKYAEALTLLGKIDSKSDILSKITSDLLNTVVKGPKQTFLCEDVMKKYPASLSYSMLICRMLVQKRKGQKISESSLKTLGEQIKRESADKVYLEKLARELK